MIKKEYACHDCEGEFYIETIATVSYCPCCSEPFVEDDDTELYEENELYDED